MNYHVLEKAGAPSEPIPGVKSMRCTRGNWKIKTGGRGEIGLAYNWASWLTGLFTSSGMDELVWSEKIAFRKEVETWLGARRDG